MKVLDAVGYGLPFLVLALFDAVIFEFPFRVFYTALINYVTGSVIVVTPVFTSSQSFDFSAIL